MTELVRDGFNGTPGDDLTTYNPGWVRQSGVTASLQIATDGSSACATTSTSTAAYVRSDITPPTADYFVSLDVTLLAVLSNAAAIGVLGRGATGAITHYQFRFVASSNPPNGSWQLRRIVNNTATVLNSVSGTFDAGETHNLKVGTSGTLVSAYLDNNPTPILGPTASTISDAGFGGWLGSNAPASRVRADNFVIDDGQAGSSNTAITPISGTAVISGFAPSISQTANQAVTPGAKVMGIAGYAPTISIIAAEVPDSTSITPAPQTPPFTLRGFAPTLVRGDSKSLAPNRRQVMLTGYAPMILQYSGITPDYFAATIMRAGSANVSVDALETEINRTVSFP